MARSKPYETAPTPRVVRKPPAAAPAPEWNPLQADRAEGRRRADAVAQAVEDMIQAQYHYQLGFPDAHDEKARTKSKLAELLAPVLTATR